MAKPKHNGHLQLDPKNARRHSPRNQALIRQSLETVGAGRSILADANGIVRAGNGVFEQWGDRPVKIVETDGKQLVVVKRTDLKGKAAVRAAMLDNLAADSSYADYDAEILAEIARDDELIAALAREDKAITALLQKAEPQAEKVDAEELADRSDEIQEKWHCALGDVWAIGEHLLFCADSEKDWARLTKRQKAKLTLTDPPYGINVVSNFTRADGAGKAITIASGTIRARGAYPFGGKKNMRGTDGAAHWVDATRYRPVHGDDKPFDPTWLFALSDDQIIWGGNYFASKLKDSRCWIVWDKNNTGNFADAELAWTSFGKGVRLYRHTWNGLVRAGKRQIEGERRLHPTQKPASLLSEIVRDFTDEGDLIYDPYAGSGSTVIACEMSRRSCWAAELEPSYCAVTLERLSNLGLTPRLLTAQVSRKVSDGKAR